MGIKIVKLTHIYGQGLPFAYQALNELDLELELGKIIAIVGKTGSGKSTLIQHLNALLLPSGGYLELLDYHIEANQKTDNLKALRGQVGLVFQFSENQLFEETVLKDVAFGPRNFNNDANIARVKALKTLELVGLNPDLYTRSPLDLSGGQKRKVAIAGILALDPKILVLDEPTAGLDPKSAKELMQLLVRLNQEFKKTIILVTHDNELVYNYASEVVLIEKGKVKAHKETKAFFEDEEFVSDQEIVLPQVLALKKALIAKGFDLNAESKLAKTLRGIINE